MSFLDDMKKIAKGTENKAETNEVERRNKILSNISKQCHKWASTVRNDIEKDAKGEGSWEGHSLGFLHYHFEDERGGLLKIEKYFDRIKAEDIEQTDGYKELKHMCESLGVSVTSKESDDIDESINRETTVVEYFVEIGTWS